MLDSLEQALQGVRPAELADGINLGLYADLKVVEKELSVYLPN